MSFRIYLLALVAAVIGSTVSSVAPLFADTFGTGDNQFEIDFVTVGNPGNRPDTSFGGIPRNAGSVPYVYRMSSYEISEEMIHKANAETAGTSTSLNIAIDSRGPSKPATNIFWFGAARFVNWLNTSSGYQRAYKLERLQTDPFVFFELWQPGDVGFNPENPYRNTQAHYFLPSLDEWYKAAYFNPSTDVYYEYPNGSSTQPIPISSGTGINTAVYGQSELAGPADITLAGGPSAYGTVGQGGNVAEWQESELDGVNNNPLGPKLYRGGNWNSPLRDLSFERVSQLGLTNGNSAVGFRVASVPEPRSLFLNFGLVLCFLNPVMRRLAQVRVKSC